MLENSVKAIKEVLAVLEVQIQANKQLLQDKEVALQETIKQKQKILGDSTSPPIERLRTLIVNYIETQDIHQIHKQQESLMLGSLFGFSIGMLQEEVAYELNLLKAKNLLQTPKSEQSEKYAEIEKELQRVKNVIDEEWKPLMEGLRDEIEKRNKFLNENR